MPVYEYVCRACQGAFEELVRGDESVACPACRSRQVEKQFSTFDTHHAARSTGTPSAREMGPGACGSCGDPRGPGACASD